MECTMQCAEGQRCGFNEFKEQQCYKSCDDETCGGHGTCRQVYGEDFRCDCDKNAFLHSGTKICQLCEMQCEVYERCGAVLGGAGGACHNDCTEECSAMSFCAQPLSGDEFLCYCPVGYAGDSCENCASGYERHNSQCYKLECGAAVPGFIENTCSGNGSCLVIDDVEHKVFCKCNEGFDYETGCKTCLNGFELVENTCQCNTGYIAAVLDGVDVCVKSQCIAYNGKTCSGKGTCDTWEEGNEILMECNCDDNRDPSDLCKSCLQGFYEDPSLLECLPNNCGTPVCNDHGACVTTSAGRNCVCDTGFNPSLRCKLCLPDYELKDGVCKKDESQSGLIAIIIVCIIIAVTGIGAVAWLVIRKRRMVSMDEALLDEMTVVDQGQMDPMTKGLQIQI